MAADDSHSAFFKNFLERYVAERREVRSLGRTAPSQQTIYNKIAEAHEEAVLAQAPVLQRIKRWYELLPLTTRLLLTTLGMLYVATSAYAYVYSLDPYTHLCLSSASFFGLGQVYRAVSNVFVHNYLLHLAFDLALVVPHAQGVEGCLGSFHLLYLFLLLAFLGSALGVSATWLLANNPLYFIRREVFHCTIGCTGAALGLVAVDTEMNQHEQYPILWRIPVPAALWPWLVLVLVQAQCALGGFDASLLANLGGLLAGWAYAKGYLRWVYLTPRALALVETSHLLELCGMKSSPAYVPASWVAPGWAGVEAHRTSAGTSAFPSRAEVVLMAPVPGGQPDWHQYLTSELREECAKRGLNAVGARENLIIRLNLFRDGDTAANTLLARQKMRQDAVELEKAKEEKLDRMFSGEEGDLEAGPEEGSAAGPAHFGIVPAGGAAGGTAVQGAAVHGQLLVTPSENPNAPPVRGQHTLARDLTHPQQQEEGRPRQVAHPGVKGGATRWVGVVDTEPVNVGRGIKGNMGASVAAAATNFDVGHIVRKPLSRPVDDEGRIVIEERPGGSDSIELLKPNELQQFTLVADSASSSKEQLEQTRFEEARKHAVSRVRNAITGSYESGL